MLIINFNIKNNSNAVSFRVRLACLYNSRVYILIANKHVVQDIKAALPFVFNVDKHGDLEEKVISTMSDSKLLSLARSHEQDSLGVEIMQYVNSCFETCVGQNLQISRLNASALDNVTSVHENNDEFFRRSTAFRYYDYGLTGRINKVDGLFVFRVFSQNRSVYRWLLNLEVDGQDKTKESFSCAMKMWQSVDINRARTPDAITFTLRANIYKMHTHRFPCVHRRQHLSVQRRDCANGGLYQQRHAAGAGGFCLLHASVGTRDSLEHQRRLL